MIEFKRESDFEDVARGREYGIHAEDDQRVGGLYVYDDLGYTSIHTKRNATQRVDTTDLDVLKVIVAGLIAGAQQ